MFVTGSHVDLLGCQTLRKLIECNCRYPETMHSPSGRYCGPPSRDGQPFS